MTVNIHGKEYVTVAERVQMAHEELDTISITTEIVTNDSLVIVKATVTTPKGTFQGTSAANPTKLIEKMSPYEVAETSAIGRALGFAGYGVVLGIASADEVFKAQDSDIDEGLNRAAALSKSITGKCPICGAVGEYHKKDCPNVSIKQVESIIGGTNVK